MCWLSFRPHTPGLSDTKTDMESLPGLSPHKTLLLRGEGPLHQWGRGLPRFVQGLGRRGAQAAPVGDASRLVVVVPRHRPAAQDVLQRPEDGTCTAERQRASNNTATL